MGQLLMQSVARSGHAPEPWFSQEYFLFSEGRADLGLIECDTNRIG
jgi:hypothetical protein